MFKICKYGEMRRMIYKKFKTVRDFARSVGLSESMVSHILHGRKPLYPWNVKLFAEALNVSEEAIKNVMEVEDENKERSS